MTVKYKCTTCLSNELARKWPLAEIKTILIQVAHDLLEDEVYTREEAARTLIDVIQRVAEEESVELSICGMKK